MIAWAPGTELGPYVLVSPIGVGGMGEVWKARDTRLQRDVAIKRLTGEHHARFEQEARAIAALNHPHICTLHDVGPDYLVMEYVDGRLIRGPLPPEEAIRLALQIADALEEAHSRGILHRDLKPNNVMVTTKGTAKLLDFGLAKAIVPELGVTQTIEGTVAGTAAYMSPEQAEGKPLDRRSDIFSFGAVLYELLSGRQAFRGESTISTLAAILHTDPAPLDAPSGVGDVVARCLSKTPSARFATMGEVRAALRALSIKPAVTQPSIAVLPFANMSRDKDDEYFSDGLAEEIINLLAHVPGLKVTARTSAFAFRGKEQDIRKIAETLNVRTILEGSVRRAGTRIRVTAQLINAEDGYHLWSERYDREMADVFVIQDEIAEAIAAALKVRLSPEVEAPRRHTPALAAYETYLMARYHQWKVTPEGLAKSGDLYEQAIAMDPQFALAHIGRADRFLMLAGLGLMAGGEAMPLIRSGAKAALDLDDSLPEAHAMLGIVAVEFDHDWKEADRRFQLALARDPVPPQVRHWYAHFYLASIGRAQEGAKEIERLLNEDPLNVMARWTRGLCLMAAGRDIEAATEYRRCLELDESFPLGVFSLGVLCALQGDFDEALRLGQRAHVLLPWGSYSLGLLAGALQRTGRGTQAEKLLEQLQAGVAYGVPVGLATFYLVCGDADKATEWLGKAIDQHHPVILTVLARPAERVFGLSGLWPELARRINLPDAMSASN